MRAALATVLFALSALPAFAEPEPPQAIFSFTAPRSAVVQAETKGRLALSFCSKRENLTQYITGERSVNDAFVACVSEKSHGNTKVISYGDFQCVEIHMLIVERAPRVEQSRPHRTPTASSEPIVVSSGALQCVSTGNAP